MALPRNEACGLALVVLFGLHVWASLSVLRPAEFADARPLFAGDYPAHAHRVHIYREALRQSGLPWGCDPAVSAGLVMSPLQDTGARPIELLGLALATVPPPRVVKLALAAAMFVAPLGTLLAVRVLGLGLRTGTWAFGATLFLLWCHTPFAGAFRWGLISFASASSLAPLVLALFLSFINRPGLPAYALFLAAFAVLSLLHPLGPLVLALPLAGYTLAARPLRRRWRAAAMFAPIAAVLANAFWLLPLVAVRWMPATPWAARSVAWRPELTFNRVADIGTVFSPMRGVWMLVRLGLCGYGLLVLRRRSGARVAGAFALAVALAFGLVGVGSFVPGVAALQPLRFLLPLLALMAVPVGAGLADLAGSGWMPPVRFAACVSVAVAASVSCASLGNADRPDRDYVGDTLVDGTVGILDWPRRTPQPPFVSALLDYILKHVAADERLLVETVVKCESRVLAVASGREIIGSSYPDVRDPLQFAGGALWGREFADWTPADLRPALARWGISRVAARSPAGRRLMADTLGAPEALVGGYAVFRVPGAGGRFAVGSGLVRAGVNRIELRDLKPEDGRIVLRYRYHPAWHAGDAAIVERVPVPEDPAGFLGLRTKASALTLAFDPLAMLRKPWAAAGAPLPPVTARNVLRLHEGERASAANEESR